MNLTIRELTRMVKGQLVLGDPRGVVTSLSLDSRTVMPSGVFFALKGERSDGHDFLDQVCKKKAAAVVVSRVDWMDSTHQHATAVIEVHDVMNALQQLGQSFRHSFQGPVVGITGSNGKTTTKQMVASVLQAQGPGLFTEGNFNSQVGLPVVLSHLEEKHQWMVLEMGASAPGHIAKLAEMAHPQIGVLTSIGPAHLATFGSLQRIAESKWELMESLPSDGCAIVPWGVPLLEPLIRCYKKKIIFFGENSSCPVRATALETGEKVSFLLHIGSQNIRVRLPLSGRYNVFNALAAAAVGWILNISIDRIAEKLEKFEPPKMRNEIWTHPSGAVLVNDAYNANPASMSQAVRAIIESYPGKKITLVLGSMLELGDDSDKYHFHLGTELAKIPVEKVFLTGVETKQIVEGAVSSGAPKDRYIWAPVKEEIVQHLKKKLSSGQVILFKASRGMEFEKIIKDLIN